MSGVAVVMAIAGRRIESSFSQCGVPSLQNTVSRFRAFLLLPSHCLWTFNPNTRSWQESPVRKRKTLLPILRISASHYTTISNTCQQNKSYKNDLCGPCPVLDGTKRVILSTATPFRLCANHEPSFFEHYRKFSSAKLESGVRYFKPWSIMENTAGDLEAKDLFQRRLLPGSERIHAKPFPDNPEYIEYWNSDLFTLAENSLLY